MRSIALTLLLATAACSTCEGSKNGGADCTGSFLAFAPSNFDRCDVEAPKMDLAVDSSGWVLDTDSGILDKGGGVTVTLTEHVEADQASGPGLALFSFNSFAIKAGASLRIQGSRAAVIVSRGDILIDGVLSAAAVAGASGPGGGDASYCAVGQGQSGSSQVDGNGDPGGSGGSGGGFGSAGGNGAGMDGALPGTSSGRSEGVASLIPLRGGCAGGKGGDGPTAGTGGTAGAAGGAVQLVAAGKIAVASTGAIAVQGTGGGGGALPAAGGGGGGAGGAILLEARDIALAGYLIASGGGGGEGADNTTAGLPGDSAGNTDVASPVGGATAANGAGGNGGSGSAGVEPQGGTAGNSTGAGVARGGGGGGGAYGRIQINSYAGTLSKDDSRIVPAASVKSP